MIAVLSSLSILLSIATDLQQGMESGGFYRRGAASGSTGARTNAFYSHQFPSIDGEGLNGGAGRLQTGELENKIDQMMGMLSGTQQLLLAQQATTQRLENSINKVNAEVETLQTDLKKISEEVAGTTQSGKGKSTRNVPTELKVSHDIILPVMIYHGIEHCI